MVFFFNDTATTEIYTLSLHDALPISGLAARGVRGARRDRGRLSEHTPLSGEGRVVGGRDRERRSEEHTSELQSRQYLVCRLLLEKKKKPLPRGDWRTHRSVHVTPDEC